MGKGLLVLLLLLSSGSLSAQSFDHAHPRFTEVLNEFVVVADDGFSSSVKYSALADNREKLDAYLASLSEVSEAQYRNWNRDQRLAFLINAYNGFTLQLIINHIDSFESGEADSIRDLGSLFTSPWEQSFFELLGSERTLDWIEHERIRVDFNEPRIHAALVCAAVSCPKLRAESFVAARLDAQLELQMISFLSDRKKNGIDDEGVYLSKIFDWYGADFNGLANYLKSYANALGDNEAQRQRIQSGDYDPRFSTYDWRLNSVNSN